MDSSFKVGDRAVYPAQGVAEVVSIETKEISGNSEVFYILKVLNSEKRIMIPVSKVASVGLRDVITGKDAEEVFTVLKERNVRIDNTTWNRRYRRYLDKIKSGNVTEVAEVLRDLYILKEDKPLSFGERKMLDTARELLVQELSVSRGLTDEDVLEELRDIFGDDEPLIDDLDI